ncbi:prepilin-type N-terminal cleavage/methylation domain-containing protein [Chromobacterium vaccinii]|uniref:type IV pilus modification PilV family protein n=1 Tax=Chromobacterium vaccinii TaxID=1108595 RepID=UPI001E367DC5|nr:prepilin-type N-terminal cleavage/methylation domain-containing protein [Chromobacterium vaccinii]MCD4485979.1 prepilin-type N-terminal cleavage/methylation domain-containing protein [Chromobacterium vaccinii]
MKTRPPRGFTLLEMMISLLVLAVGALGLLRLETQLLHSQIAANDYNTATNLAQAALEQRKTGKPADCRQSSYAPAAASGTLARFRCRGNDSGPTAQVDVNWTDSEGESLTLSLTAPK